MKSPEKYVGPTLLHGVRIFVAAFAGTLFVIDRVIRAYEKR